MSSSMTPSQIQAAQAFAGATVEALREGQGVHAETAIAATARMAGTFLFRSFDFPLPDVQPGQAVLSDNANERGPELLQILGGLLTQLGVALDPQLLDAEPGPEHQPRRGFLDTQRRIEPLYDAIRLRLDLSLEQAAHAAAVATAIVIRQCAQVLHPSVAFAIAAYGFVEGAKTAPAPLGALA